MLSSLLAPFVKCSSFGIRVNVIDNSESIEFADSLMADNVVILVMPMTKALMWYSVEKRNYRFVENKNYVVIENMKLGDC